MRTGWPKVDFLQAGAGLSGEHAPALRAGTWQGRGPQPAPMSFCSWPAPRFVPGSDGLGEGMPQSVQQGLWALPRPRAGSPALASPQERGEGRGGRELRNSCPAADSRGQPCLGSGEFCSHTKPQGAWAKQLLPRRLQNPTVSTAPSSWPISGFTCTHAIGLSAPPRPPQGTPQQPCS